MDGTGTALLRAVLGDRTEGALNMLELGPRLQAETDDHVDRHMLAMALNIALFDDLLTRVPSGSEYVSERLERGERIVFDHGALRTIRFPEGPTGALPAGEAAFTRILKPLGYELSGTYPLPRLKMTGRSYAFADAPEELPQFFVSELHVEEFSETFAAAAHRVFDSSQDPLSEEVVQALAELEEGKTLTLPRAQRVLVDCLAAFDRQHSEPTISDYEILREESGEAAWIATEGNAFNHATDRVEDVEALSEAEREAGRPIKDRVEVSASGRVRQTAHRAAQIRRIFVNDSGRKEELNVPGSFYEFITRDVDPESGKLDLGFDSGNATGIFAMTRSS
ncbi:DUF1338 family protein [Altererythrobacter endophyticus]|uniref:2-oxoadipate dioxygenase/decarboxylase n=2 Tax=Altericroceibacterium endophyticum TaxID=1808508 RepID=A0A6I4T8I8_9SPHN|nr:DUF1338 family protein [Altericroceibacterium endophyticum]MXO66180.1 DUF1338 family protein [Altericroceibacterium endophyticum]